MVSSSKALSLLKIYLPSLVIGLNLSLILEKVPNLGDLVIEFLAGIFKTAPWKLEGSSARLKEILFWDFIAVTSGCSGSNVETAALNLLW